MDQKSGSKSSAKIGTKAQTGGGKTSAGPHHGTSKHAGGSSHGHVGRKR